MNNISPSLREAIVAEVGPEKILWSGKPDPRSLAQREWANAAVGAFAVCFAVLWFTALLRSSAQRTDPRFIFMLAAGTCLLAFFLSKLFAPLFAARRARRMTYVLTERRALVFEQRRKVEISTFSLAQVCRFERDSIDGAAVDLVFQRIVKRRRRSTEKIALGFLGLRDFTAAEAALRDLAARHARATVAQEKGGP